MAGRRATSTSNLDSNLDALLDDLQTSISTGNSSSRHRVHQSSSTPQHSTTRIVETSHSRKSPLRSMSPALHTTSSPSGSGAREVTVEKYVSTGPAGTASGIPGLEMLDKELADVQPGQSKTVAYKQVSYHYDKSQEGKDLEPWVKTDKISKNDASIVDDFCERTFNQTSSSRPVRDVTDYGKTNQEIIYKADVSSKTIPVVQPVSTESRSTERDFKYVKETSYHTEPSPISPRKNIKTVRTDETEELTNVEYIPASTPIQIPEPGPNTKVTTTIKTYTYEVPRTPITTTTTSTTSTLNKNLEKSISYTSSLPREHVPEKTLVHHIEERQRGVREYVPSPSPTSSRVHREQKIFVEERRGYRAPSPPPPVTTSSTLTRSEKYLQESRSNGYGPSPSPGIDYPDHAVSRTTERVVYSSEPPIGRPIPVETTGNTTRTVKQYEEHYASGARPPKPTYYPSNETHTSTTHVYKQYEESNLMPKPFPTSERPVSPRQEPPKRIEDLMSSFSESKEVVEVMEKRDQRKGVDFVPHSPPIVQSKNIAGPPVYYPPGSAEFKKREEHMVAMSAKGGGEGWQKEESMSAMSKRSGGWEKKRAAWEYGGSERHEEKTKSKKAVVPMCLPLCCALPCVIM
ncbi:mucin-5AC isoform X2 [Phymastichus coffea]|uniref:mucin-5AC isoform X2 n=1 Tax=Phymastichus coffea TaxID=108790 RepID=UPI00273CE996|nr:mucin-5AC isoform X2 [Phymastichus coffea]